MDRRRNSLLEPRFAADPPVKLNINASVLGLVIAILAGLAVISELFSLITVLSASVVVASVGFGGIVALAAIGLLADIAAAVMAALGGWRMYQRVPAGKNLVIYALVLAAVAEVVVGVGYASIAGAVVGLILLFIVYYLVVISSFPESTRGSGPTP